MSKSSIKDVQVIPVTGSWVTKSHADLDLLLNFDLKEIDNFFYDGVSLADKHLSGLRLYRVSNIKLGSEGANEWHKQKKEIFLTTKGSIKWTLTDQTGSKIIKITNKDTGAIYIPTHILHVYEALEESSEIIVIANTKYIEGGDQTHDIFSADSF